MRSVLTKSIFLLLLVFSISSSAATGYQLFFDGKRVGYEPAWDIYKALGNLHWNINKHKHKSVEGWHNDVRIKATGQGYELYFNGSRVGYEPNWTLQQAVKNLHWNRNKHKTTDVRAWFNGSQM